MKKSQTLQRRIVIAFGLLAIVLCGAFATATYSIIHRLESELYYDHLQRYAEWMIRTNQKFPQSDLPEDIQLYVTNGEMPGSLPDFLQTLQSDRTEVVLDDKAYYVIVLAEGGKRYFLVQDQSEFESFEKALALSIAIGFVLVVVGAVLFGWITSRYVVAPVIRLAEKVQGAESSKSLIELSPEEFPDDEIGLLALRLSEFAKSFQGFLDRERLFTGDVSHELRTPLMIITSSCELQLSRSDQNDPQRQIINRIYAAAKDMLELVDTFLQLTRENEHARAGMLKFSVNKIIFEETEALKGIDTGTKSPGIVINDGADLTVFGVPQLFRVVVRNLLRNALHYTQTGSIVITVRPDSVVIDDSGVGIPSGLRNVIFERNVRSENRAGESEGHGLGLSIVKRICDFHDWSILYEPLQPSGSRFTVNVGSNA